MNERLQTEKSLVTLTPVLIDFAVSVQKDNDNPPVANFIYLLHV